jgi:hypothetical protein
VVLLACVAALPARADNRPVPQLDGDWQLDAAASDSFDEQLAKVAETMRAKMKARRGSGGGMRGGFPGRGPDGQGGVDANGVPMLMNEPPPESRDELGERLSETFRPPRHLQIRSDEGEVRMLGDAPPERRYNLQETVTRMDLSGTSTLRTTWTGSGLLVDSRYTNRSHSVTRYTLDRAGAVLTVSLELTEPISGKLQLRSVYRRVEASARAVPVAR